MWHATHAVWPIEACIQHLDGSRICTDVSSEEATDVVQQSLELFAAYNTPLGTDSVYTLGRPSPDTCPGCDYVGACPAFFGEVDASWERFSKNVLGLVAEVEGEPPRFRLTLEVDASNLPPETNSVAIRDLHDEVVPEVGERVAVVNARPTREPTQLTSGWDTEVWTWD